MDEIRIYKWAVIENIATLIICGASMVGLYAFGAGAHSFWALLLLLNINHIGCKKDAPS